MPSNTSRGCSVGPRRSRTALIDVARPAPNPPVDKKGVSWSVRTPTPESAPTPPYLIVFETPGPHATLATAQELRNVRYFGIVGTLRANAPIDLFQIPIDPTTLSLQFTLKSDQPGAAPAQRLQLLDAQGHSLGDWSLADGPQGQTLSISEVNRLPGSVLYLGIIPAGMSGDGDGTAAPVGYQVWIMRQTTSDPSPDTSAGSVSVSLASGPLPLFPITVRVDSVPSSPGQGTTLGAGAVAPTDSVAIATAPRQVVAGPLPTLSAAPWAGVLSERDPEQPIARLVIAGTDLDHPDNPPSPEADPEPRQVVDSAGPASVGETPVLITWHGPGGYPLLGAAPTGDWRGPRVDTSGAGEEVIGVDDLDQQQPGGTSPAIGVAGSVALPPPTPEPPRELSPTPVRTGLSMAAALAFGILISDPAAVFQSVIALRRPVAWEPLRASKRNGDAFRGR